MKKLFASNKYLPVALALGALTAAGSTPAFAHAAGYFGGPLSLHYLSDGSKAPKYLPGSVYIVNPPTPIPRAVVLLGHL